MIRRGRYFVCFLVIFNVIRELASIRYENFYENARKAKLKDPGRLNAVNRTLASAAGVYTDRLKGALLGLEKTIVLTVGAFDIKGVNHHYEVFFRNLLCYTNHYEIDVVLYFLHHHFPNEEDASAKIYSFADLGVKALTYPDELFWSMLATKQTPIDNTRGRADYKGEIPTFSNFGAFVMLVPVLEALNLGYNVIFIDVDQGWVQDPIPYLIKGNADFVSSVELRQCPVFYSSGNSKPLDWYNVEPNTGVMHVRATSQGKNLFRQWLEVIVGYNYINDQKAFKAGDLGLQYTDNCHRDSTEKASPHNKQSDTDFINATDSNRKGTFCFLPEILFQNGLVAVKCAIKRAHRDEYIVEMASSATLGKYPVIVHVNYCDRKTDELRDRGLWLLSTDDIAKQDICKEYSRNNTLYGKTNFAKEAIAISAKRDNILHNEVINGSLIHLKGTKTVYLVRDRVRYAIPDKQTFEYLFKEESHEKLKTLPLSVVEEIPDGGSLDSVKLSNGTLIKSHNSNVVYMIDEKGKRREIPDQSTFERHFGTDYGIVKAFGDDYVNSFPMAAMLASVKASTH